MSNKRRRTHVGGIGSLGQMGIDAQSRAVGLGESPENVLGSLVDVGSAGGVGQPGPSPACGARGSRGGRARCTGTGDIPVYSGK